MKGQEGRCAWWGK